MTELETVRTQATGGDPHKKTMASAVMTGKILNLAADNQWCANLLNSVADAVREEITNYVQQYMPFDKKNGAAQIESITTSFLGMTTHLWSSGNWKMFAGYDQVQGTPHCASKCEKTRAQ